MLLEKLAVSELSSNFLTFYGTQSLIISLVPILRHMNLLHILPRCFFKISFNIILPYMIGLPNALFL
jgi:hypothetical protein